MARLHERFDATKFEPPLYAPCDGDTCDSGTEDDAAKNDGAESATATGATDDRARRLREAERFLGAFDAEAESWCFQTFDDSGRRGELARTLHGDLAELFDTLDALNLRGAGVFVTINEVAPGTPRTASNVVRVRACFADFDKTDPPEVYPLPPVLEVESSPGRRHSYWTVDALPLNDFERQQRSIAAALGSDPAVCDLPRVMRVPGFRHQKDPSRSHWVRIIATDERLPYPAAALAEAFPPVAAGARASAANDAPPPVTITPAQVTELRSALFHLRSDDRELWVQMGHALRELGDVGRGLWLTWSATSEKFDPADAARVWDSLKPERTSYGAVFAAAQRAGWTNPLSNAARVEVDESNLPEPSPLPRLPTVPEFPLEILPDELRPWVEDAADRARFRPDFAAAASMAALGSVIGRKIGIRLKQRDDWTEHANVWGALVGPPSALKSPALREALRPLKALQVGADQAHREGLIAYEAENDAYKLRKDAKKKSAAKVLSKDPDAEVDLSCVAPPEPPPCRVYWTSDATAERLGELLAENPTGLLVERDELSSLLTSLEDERHAAARGLYLSGWSGKEGYRFDRIIRGTTTLPKFAISMVGGIQPGPLARYVRSAFSGERADGLLQRFQLIVWPDPEPFEYVDRHPRTTAKDAARQLFERADTFSAESVGVYDTYAKDGDPPFVRFAPDAQEVFTDWYVEFMRERRELELGGAESAPVSAHFGKYPGLLAKLALILHVADDPGAKAVSRRTLLKALGWLQYLRPHALRVYHAIDSPETTAGELLLARLRQGALPPQFKPRDIYRKHWHGLSDKDAVRAACRLLEDYGWLVELPTEHKGGRPADPTYAVSPRVEVQP